VRAELGKPTNLQQCVGKFEPVLLGRGMCYHKYCLVFTRQIPEEQ